jgi:hypothetical protein
MLPSVLFLIHLLPENIKDILTLGTSNLEIWALYTTVFVHGGRSHLINNIAAYMLYIVPFYISMTLINREKFFRVVLVFSVTILPLVLSILNLMILTNFSLPGSVGFSGVNSFYIGLLPIAFFLYLQKHVSPTFDVKYALSFFIYSISLAPIILIGLTLQNIIIVISLNFLGLIYLYNQYSNFEASSLTEIKEKLEKFVGKKYHLKFVSLNLLLFIMAPFLIIVSSEQLVKDGKFTNILIHYAGYSIGFLMPYYTEIWKYFGE